MRCKIQSVIGNQSVQNGNFESALYWSGSQCSISINENVCTLTKQTTSVSAMEVYQNFNDYFYKNGHKYLCFFKYFIDINEVNISTVTCNVSGSGAANIVLNIVKGSWQTYSNIFTANNPSRISRIQLNFRTRSTTEGTAMVKDTMLIDLTEIYGAGNEPSTIEEFLDDYPMYENYVPYGGYRQKYVIRDTLVPSEYTQVEFIESNGYQYFSTGVLATEKTEVSIKYQVTKTSTNQGYGIIGYQAGFKVAPTLARIIWSNQTNDQIRYQNLILETSTQSELNKIYEETFGNGFWTKNGVKTTLYNYGTFTLPEPLELFCLNANGTLTSYSNIRVYKCSIYDNDTLIRDFIPCIRKSDNIAGMYDRITKQFYTSQGFENFIAGPKITTRRIANG